MSIFNQARDLLKNLQGKATSIGTNAVQSWKQAPLVGGLVGQAIQQAPQAIKQYANTTPFISLPGAGFTPKLPSPTIGQYAQGQIIQPFKQGIQGLQTPGKLNKVIGGAQLLGSGFSATPIGMLWNAGTGTLGGIGRSVRTGENLDQSIKRGISEPTSLAMEGLGVQNPYLALGADVLLTRNPKSSIKNIKSLRAVFNKPIRMDSNDIYELDRAIDTLRNRSVKVTPQAKKQAKNILYNLAEKYASPDELKKVDNTNLTGLIRVLQNKAGEAGGKSGDYYIPGMGFAGKNQVKPSGLEGGGVKGTSQKAIAQNLPEGQVQSQQGIAPSQTEISPQQKLVQQSSSVEIPSSGSKPSSLRPSGQIIPEGQKERQFIETVREAKNTKKDVASQIEGFYSPETNKEQVQRAIYTVDTSYDLAKQRVLNESLTAETNAIGQEIIRRAQNAGKFDEAIEITEALARKGTEAGKSVQAFSIWARLTPQGLLRYAQKEFLNANQKMDIITKVWRKAFNKPEIKLTAEDGKVITGLMDKANKTANEAERAALIKQAFEYIGKKLPWGVSDLLDEYRYNNMLSNPLTHLRNIVSNLQQTFITRPATLATEGRPLEAIKYEIGALRSLPEAFSAFKYAFKHGSPLGKLDDAGIAKIGAVKPQRLKGLNLPSKAMESMDQFFSTLIKGGEKARGSTDEAADLMAQYSLFRQDLNPKQQGYLLNKIDDVTKAVYQLRKVGLGWFIPFIRTPMNVAKQWIEYSPMGLATLPGAGNKRSQLAKTLLGSMVTALGAEMALEGRTTWAAPTDPTQKQLFYDAGKKPFSIKIGDKWVPMQSLGVFAWAVGLPAAYQYYQSESRTALTDSQLEKLAQTALSGLNFWSQQTFVSGLGSFVNIARGDVDYSIPKNVAQAVNQLKPWDGLMRYISTVVDPIYRKPKGFTQQLIADIPGLTKTLPAYTNTKGEPSTRNITNYIAPYAMGQANPEFEPMLQSRTQKLQLNALINKDSKEYSDIDTQIKDLVKADNKEKAKELIQQNKDLLIKGEETKKFKKAFDDLYKDLDTVQSSQKLTPEQKAQLTQAIQKRIDAFNKAYSNFQNQ